MEEKNKGSFIYSIQVAWQLLGAVLGSVRRRRKRQRKRKKKKRKRGKARQIVATLMVSTVILRQGCRWLLWRT